MPEKPAVEDKVSNNNKNKRASDDESRPRSAKKRRMKTVRRVTWRVVLCVLTALALVLVTVLCVGWEFFRGPSRTVGDLLTVTLLETSAMKFVPRIYYSKAEVQEIVDRNSVGEMVEDVNTELINIGTPEIPQTTPAPAEVQVVTAPTPTPIPVPESTREPVIDEDGLQIYEVKGSTYHGYMTVVQDPSRVSVGICNDGFSSNPGKRLNEIAERYNAVAAINAGGFEDTHGAGNGGQPLGMVVSQGQLYHGTGYYSTVIGFNKDNILVFGDWSTREAYDQGIRDAVAFGPVLVSNGEPVAKKGSGSGLNPRTGIGQRADGAVLMLIIEGRNASSLGGTFSDMIELFMDFGAVNAANLDGGSSSMLYYKGDYVSNGVVLTGSRRLPTAFIVN